MNQGVDIKISKSQIRQVPRHGGNHRKIFQKHIIGKVNENLRNTLTIPLMFKRNSSHSWVTYYKH